MRKLAQALMRVDSALDGVQVPSLAPNKVDNFDTTGIETINLILFVKMLDLQGFSVSW